MPDTFHTVDEVAELLKVSRRSVTRWIRSGELKAIQLGRIWRISTASLDAFIESREYDPEHEKVDPSPDAPEEGSQWAAAA